MSGICSKHQSHMAGCPRCETVHCCPLPGQQLTPCCQKTPFELPAGDRLTLDVASVTCTMDQ
jgi:hypothetical protein